MRFNKYLFEAVDTDDVGYEGKKFEDLFLKAFELLDLKYILSSGRRVIWDYRPIGDEWNRLISGKDVNIKISGTKWLFGTAELGNMVPYEEGFKDENEITKIEKQIKKWIKSKEIHKTYYLKPNTSDVQKQIIAAVKSEDIEKLDKLITKKNFKFEKLGNNFDVEISTNKNLSVKSIKILKGGKTFMRSEKPRKVGGSKNFVAFKSPSSKLGDKNRKVVTK